MVKPNGYSITKDTMDWQNELQAKQIANIIPNLNHSLKMEFGKLKKYEFVILPIRMSLLSKS